MNDLLVPLVVVSQVALIGLVVWVVARRLEQKAQLRAELHLKLLERFSSVQELEQFLSTDTGRRLLGIYAMQSRSPVGRTVGAAQVGLVLVVLGLGVLLVAFLFAGPGGRTPGLAGKAVAMAMAVAVVIMALGCGLVAAAVVGRRLAKAWALDGEAPGAPGPPPPASTIPARTSDERPTVGP